MIHWIFDLDNTLYRFIDIQNQDLKKIAIDTQLPEIIRLLPGNKLIFTNANQYHSINMISKLKMYNCFNAILNRDLLQGIKPNPMVYFKLIQWCKIQNNDKVIFFEDTPENLMVAKQFGWITILITDKNPENIKENYIDMCFKDTKTAIQTIIRKVLFKSK